MNGEGPEGVEIVNGSQCNVCGKPAVIHDLEYDEYYCQEHGEEYEVSTGPHERLADREEGTWRVTAQGEEYVTKTGKVLTQTDIEALADEAEAGYDVSKLKEHRRLRAQRLRDLGVAGVVEEEEDFPASDRMPWTITIEVTIDSQGAQEAEIEGAKMVEHIVSGWDGAAGAVMRVEPNA